tara:strand:+ start:893 stop:1357 length:465 start_codon:yes stop_codon:yes gene_type:complete
MLQIKEHQSKSTLSLSFKHNQQSFLVCQEFLMLCNIAADITVSGGEACVCSISKDDFIRFKTIKNETQYESWISKFDSDGMEQSAICKIEQVYFPGLTCGVIANQIKDYFKTCTKIFLHISKLPTIVTKKDIFNENINIFETSNMIDQEIMKHL